jgi:multidrug resistance efflux pump
MGILWVVRAMVDGYVTNLNLRLGDHATANSASMALVDVNSYWVSGFFKESALERVRPGNQVIVTLNCSPDRRTAHRRQAASAG